MSNMMLHRRAHRWHRFEQNKRSCPRHDRGIRLEKSQFGLHWDVIPQLVGVGGIARLACKTESDIENTIVTICTKLHHGDTTVVVMGFGKESWKFSPTMGAPRRNVVGGRKCKSSKDQLVPVVGLEHEIWMR